MIFPTTECLTDGDSVFFSADLAKFKVANIRFR